MHGRIRDVTGAHRLEEGQCLLSTDFTDNQVFRTLTESRLEEFVHVDLPFSCDIKGFTGYTGNPVCMGQFQFTGILEGDNLCQGRNEERDGVQRGGLS